MRYSVVARTKNIYRKFYTPYPVSVSVPVLCIYELESSEVMEFCTQNKCALKIFTITLAAGEDVENEEK